MMGVRAVRNFFLSEFGWSRGTKFFTSPKLCGTSPALYDSIFVSQDRKNPICGFWMGAFSIFRCFSKGRRRVPRIQKLLPVTNREKYAYRRCTPKNRQHLTPKSTTPMYSLGTLKPSKRDCKIVYGGRGF